MRFPAQTIKAIGEKSSRNGRQDCYAINIRKLEADLQRLSQQMLSLDLQRQKFLGMQQVLLKVAGQQEHIMREVTRLQLLIRTEFAQHNLQLNGLQGGASSVEAALQDCSSYSAILLRTATLADIQRARSLTTEGWCEFYAGLSAQICLLQEVASRDPTGLQKSICTASPEAALAGAQSSMSSYTAAGYSQLDAEASPRQTNSLLYGNSRIADSKRAAKQSYLLLVDEFCRTAVISKFLIDYGAQYRKASLVNLTTGAAGTETGFQSHWLQVVKHLQLTDEQILHLQLAYEQFNRCRAAARSRQVSACQLVEANIVRKMQRLGLSGSQDSQQTNSSTASGNSITSSTLSGQQTDLHTDDEEEDSLQCLQSLLRAQTAAQQMLAVFLLDTLTREQLARFMVASYPYLPQISCLMEAIRHMLLQDRDRYCVQQQQPQHSLGTDDQESTPPVNGGRVDHIFQQLVSSSEHKEQIQARRESLEQQKTSFWHRNQHLLQLAQQQALVQTEASQ